MNDMLTLWAPVGAKRMTFCPTTHIRFGGDQLKEKQSKFREMLGTTVKCGYLLHYKSIKSDKSNSEPKYISIFRT